MRNAPELTAIAVWGLFAAAIAVAHGGGSFIGLRGGEPGAAMVSDASSTNPVITGRSSAGGNPIVGPYGALFVDPALRETPQAPVRSKASSDDLILR